MAENAESDNGRLVINPDYIVRNLDGELLLLNAQEHVVLKLNRTAGDIWQLLNQAREASSVVATLADRYATTPDAITMEVQASISELLTLGAITRVGHYPGGDPMAVGEGATAAETRRLFRGCHAGD